ncbi:MAG: M28 family peptidase [Verrucomicrobiales bacterium]
MPEPTSSAHRQRLLVRIFLLGLPLGLLLTGAGSMIWHHLHKDDADPPVPPHLADSLRRDPAAADIAATIRILSEEIGPRNIDQPAKLRAAASYLESSLSPLNMGYSPNKVTYEVPGAGECAIFEADLPGVIDPDEIVIVAAHYDSPPGDPGAADNASGIAALLALARSMTGLPQAKTVRFVAFPNGADPYAGTEVAAARFYARRANRESQRITAAIFLKSLAFSQSEETPKLAVAPADGAGSQALAAQLAKATGGTLATSGGGSGGSGTSAPPNAARFAEAGFPAAEITAGSRSEEAPAPIDAEAVAQAVLAVRKAVEALAN